MSVIISVEHPYIDHELGGYRINVAVDMPSIVHAQENAYGGRFITVLNDERLPDEVRGKWVVAHKSNDGDEGKYPSAESRICDSFREAINLAISELMVEFGENPSDHPLENELAEVDEWLHENAIPVSESRWVTRN